MRLPGNFRTCVFVWQILGRRTWKFSVPESRTGLLLGHALLSRARKKTHVRVCGGGGGNIGTAFILPHFIFFSFLFKKLGTTFFFWKLLIFNIWLPQGASFAVDCWKYGFISRTGELLSHFWVFKNYFYKNVIQLLWQLRQSCFQFLAIRHHDM